MYAAIPDPYCYPGSTVLKNLRNIRAQKDLDSFEAVMSIWRGRQSFPVGHLSVTHYRAIHHHLFQDVYAWAGRFRTVRISKAGSMFCYPENIAGQMRKLFGDLRARRHLDGLSAEQFAAQAAHFLAELNAIHPFREGNGRTQLTFLTMLADRAGHALDLDRLDPEAIMAAMIASFGGREQPLARLIHSLIVR